MAYLSRKGLYGDYSYKPLTERYVTPLELVAMALKIGEKKWAKAQTAARARLDPSISAVWMNCEIRVCLPRDLRHVQDMRGDEGWMIEAGIHPSRPEWLLKARSYLAEELPQQLPPDVVHGLQ